MTMRLVMSDLHLADGNAVLDGWGERQQAAFEGLLAAACPGGPLGATQDVELILNGDIFDFLAVPPLDTGGVTDTSIATEKLAKIIAAHGPFFETLRAFLAQPGRHLTFLTGNHDIELCFAQVRAGISHALGVAEQDGPLYFCPTRFYRPSPDVYIEHGNHYDFWNRDIGGLWDEEGQPRMTNPRTITLPQGSHYMQHAGLAISAQFPYFDHFEPSMNILRQMALLCLLNPETVVETARRTMELTSQPRQALQSDRQDPATPWTPYHETLGLRIRLMVGAQVSPGAAPALPARLFEEAMTDFAAFQQDMAARAPAWKEPPGIDAAQVQQEALLEFALLRETLSSALSLEEAVTALCTTTPYAMGDGVTAGMHHVLHNDPTLRYALAGHTHMVRIDPVRRGGSGEVLGGIPALYLNTGSWTTRVAIPAPGEVTPELIEWLHRPDWRNIPLRDVTQFIFAICSSRLAAEGTRNEHPSQDTTGFLRVMGGAGLAPALSSRASLCVWEGGRSGSYRLLA